MLEQFIRTARRRWWQTSLVAVAIVIVAGLAVVLSPSGESPGGAQDRLAAASAPSCSEVAVSELATFLNVLRTGTEREMAAEMRARWSEPTFVVFSLAIEERNGGKRGLIARKNPVAARLQVLARGGLPITLREEHIMVVSNPQGPWVGLSFEPGGVRWGRAESPGLPVFTKAAVSCESGLIKVLNLAVRQPGSASAS